MVPTELQDLELYRADEKLCKAWPELYPCWRQAYPRVDIAAEVKKAHAWEVSNPTKRKVLRSAFLNRWMAKAMASLPPVGVKPICHLCGKELVGSHSNGVHLSCERQKEENVQSAAARRAGGFPQGIREILVEKGLLKGPIPPPATPEPKVDGKGYWVDDSVPF